MNPTDQADAPSQSPINLPLVGSASQASLAKPLSEERERELMKDSVAYVYQVEDGFEGRAHCFYPEGHQPGNAKPVIVFFHGGLWDVSMATQFAPHAMHFASRGMVAICVEYRVSNKTPASTPEDAVNDASTAVMWLKHNAAELGIDTMQICVAGAASGAHMALSLGMAKEPIEMNGLTACPHSVIGLSSIVNTTKKSDFFDRFRDAKVAQKSSPSALARKGLPPMLLIHGKSDTIAPHEDVARLAKLLKRRKNQVELIEFEAMNHSFFNFNVSAKHFELTLNSMDAFLVGLGYIEPEEYL